MSALILPTILGVGYFDSSVKYRHGGVTPERISRVFELELPLRPEPPETAGTLYIDDGAYALDSDFAIIVRPGQRRHTLLPYRCAFIHLRAEGEFADRLSALPTIVQLSDFKQTAQLFRDLSFIYSSGQASELLLQSRLLELIWQLGNDSRSKQTYDGVGSETIAAALRYIDEHLEQNLSLEELAASQHISPVYFHKLFKKALGVTPYRYILDKKIAIAKNQLIMTNHSCLDIALSLGFSSQSYFNYAFRKETGLTPLQFRKDWYSRYPE